MPLVRAPFLLQKSGLGYILGLELIALVAVGLLLPGCSGSDVGLDEEQSSSDRALEAYSHVSSLPHKALCDEDPRPGMRHCHARVRTDPSGIVPFAVGPAGLSPADLRAAYKLPAAGGSGKIVAIVDAQDDPNAEADLGKYRSQFGLPACTTANGCFRKVNEN